MLKFEYWEGRVMLQIKAKDPVDLSADVGLLISLIYSKIRNQGESGSAEVFKNAMQILMNDKGPIWTKDQFPGVTLNNLDQMESFLKTLAEQKGTAADESGT